MSAAFHVFYRPVNVAQLSRVFRNWVRVQAVAISIGSAALHRGYLSIEKSRITHYRVATIFSSPYRFLWKIAKFRGKRAVKISGLLPLEVLRWSSS
jgi:hypothetical protein